MGLLKKAKVKFYGSPLKDGVTFTANLKYSQFKQGIPLPLAWGADYIEKHALDAEGIYRVSGAVKTVEQLSNEFDKGLPDANKYDPYSISGSFKRYLALLPDPLMTFDLYDKFLVASKNPNKTEKLQQIRDLVQKELPEHNRNVLAFIMQHLNRIAEHSQVNKMGVNNLAIVFGPTLFKCKDVNPVRVLTDSPILSGCVQTFLKEYNKVFGDEPIEEDSNMSTWEKMRTARLSRRGHTRRESRIDDAVGEEQGEASTSTPAAGRSGYDLDQQNTTEEDANVLARLRALQSDEDEDSDNEANGKKPVAEKNTEEKTGVAEAASTPNNDNTVLIDKAKAKTHILAQVLKQKEITSPQSTTSPTEETSSGATTSFSERRKGLSFKSIGSAAAQGIDLSLLSEQLNQMDGEGADASQQQNVAKQMVEPLSKPEEITNLVSARGSRSRSSSHMQFSSPTITSKQAANSGSTSTPASSATTPNPTAATITNNGFTWTKADRSASFAKIQEQKQELGNLMSQIVLDASKKPFHARITRENSLAFGVEQSKEAKKPNSLTPTSPRTAPQNSKLIRFGVPMFDQTNEEDSEERSIRDFISSKGQSFNKKPDTCLPTSETVSPAAVDSPVKLLENPLVMVSKKIEESRMKSPLLKDIPSEDIDSMTVESLLELRKIVKKELRNFEKLFAQVNQREPTKLDKECLRSYYRQYRDIKKQIIIKSASVPAKLTDRDMEISKSSPLYSVYVGSERRMSGSPLIQNNRNSIMLPNASSSLLSTSGGASSGFLSGSTTRASLLASPYNIRKSVHLSQQRNSMNQQFRTSLSAKSKLSNSEQSAVKQVNPLLQADPKYQDIIKEKRQLQKKLLVYEKEFTTKNGRKISSPKDRGPLQSEYTKYKLVKQKLAQYIKEVEEKWTNSHE